MTVPYFYIIQNKISKRVSPKKNVQCEYCLEYMAKHSYSRYHGFKCKYNPEYDITKVKRYCEYCDKYYYPGVYARFHGEKCKAR